MKTAILQPLVPHYREEFFTKLTNDTDIEVYCYDSIKNINKENFENSNFKTNRIKNYKLGPFIWYNPFVFLQKDYTTLVLMLDFKHLATWSLLLTKFIHKKKIILWGQGISIKRFLKDEEKPLFILKWMLKLSDGVWFYTEKEYLLWKKIIPKLNAISLNNTISDIDTILQLPKIDISIKNDLKLKYSISEPVIMIFCARFNTVRRIDLLLEIIKNADYQKFGFVIIGEGNSKPSFSGYKNVYDFGKVYDFYKKTELFNLADIYFQPAWLGLSVVEAMGYGKPVFSFKRKDDLFQCVEYFYVKDMWNGRLFTNTDEMLKCLNDVEINDLLELGQNAKTFVKNNLTMDSMVNNALSIL